MTTCLEVCSRALRALGVLGAGEEAAGDDAADALQHLQAMLDDLPLLRNGEWSEVILTSAEAYTAKDGERITTNGFDAPITLATTYEDECGRTVPQRDLSRVQILGEHDQAGMWIWSAGKGAWGRADGLGLTDELPFGAQDDAGLVAMLAVELSAEYPGEVRPATVARAQRQVTSFRARFYREVIVRADEAYLRTSDMGYVADPYQGGY